MSISDVSTVFLHHRTNDQKLLRIIHRNKNFSSQSDPKIRVRIIHECVLYAEKYGICQKCCMFIKKNKDQSVILLLVFFFFFKFPVQFQILETTFEQI